MKVFICWSEARSRVVAEYLRDWLKRVIQQLKPFLSIQDIRVGKRWHSEIAGQLSETKFGILCLTRENLDSPWINFETGALSKSIDDKTFVCPYYIAELQSTDVRDPLGQFQGVSANKEGTLKLLNTINLALADGKLDEGVLADAFEKYWPDLKKVLDNLPSAKGGEKPKRDIDGMIEEILTIVRGMVFTSRTFEENLRLLMTEWFQESPRLSLPTAMSTEIPGPETKYLRRGLLGKGESETSFEKIVRLAARDVMTEELKKIEELKKKEELKKAADMPGGKR